MNSNLERDKTKKNIWFVIASLSYIIAIGFIIAYFIGGYFPYIVIAVMWACIGSLDIQYFSNFHFLINEAVRYLYM